MAATRSFNNGSISVQVSGSFDNLNETIASAKQALSEIFTATITTGTGADQADRVYYGRRAASTTPEDIDLAAGSLTDIYGNAITFARVKLIYIKNRSTTTAEIISVGGDANGLVGWVGAAADFVNVRAGGVLLLFAPDATGYAVTAGTGDILQIVSASGTPSVDVLIIGCSA